MSAQKRLDISLLLCRLGAGLVFLIWAYDKLKIGFGGLKGRGTSQSIVSDYYYLDLPPVFFAVIGLLHLALGAALLLGLFKRPVRGYVLALCVVPFLLPNYWKGLYDGLFVVPHPTILFYSAAALCACAYASFALRDYDNLASLGPKKTADFSDTEFRKRLGLSLFFCRLAVFIVFMVWVYSKIVWPDRGVERMRNFWLMPSFPQWGVTAFAWAELVICFVFLFGFFKRWTAALFVFLGVMAVFTPRALTGMQQVFTGNSWHTILYYPGFCLLICAIVLYLLRDYDTRFTLNKKDKLKIENSEAGS